MERSSKWIHRNRLMAMFSAVASIDPASEKSKAFMQDMNAGASRIGKEAKFLSSLAIKIASAFNLNGAGLFVDRYLRKFLLEYNGRILNGKGNRLPSSMNVMRAFVEPSAETYILEILNEEVYTVQFELILDFLTDPKSDLNFGVLIDLAEEFKVYELNMLGAFSEFTVPGREEYIFCGASFVREHDEISIVGIFGAKNPDPKKASFPLAESKPFLGREDLIDADKIDVSDFPLFDDINFEPVILMMRIDLATNSVQVRYALVEKQDAYIVYSDDPTMILDIQAQMGKEREAIARSIDGLAKYVELFSLLAQIPTFLSKIREIEDGIKIVRYPTDLKIKSTETNVRKLKKSIAAKFVPNFINVNCITEDSVVLDSYQLPASNLKVENRGFWKTLPIDAIGEDKSGNPVQGKTWVEQTMSWVEKRKASENDFMKPIEIHLASQDDSDGYVYVMRSAQHPKNVFKIGFTLSDPHDRANSLSSTSGQPDFLNVVQSWKVKMPRKIEQQVHFLLKDKRVNDKREFFLEKYEKIRECIEKVIGGL